MGYQTVHWLERQNATGLPPQATADVPNPHAPLQLVNDPSQNQATVQKRALLVPTFRRGGLWRTGREREDLLCAVAGTIDHE